MDIGTMARALRAGDRRALARAITLIESARSDHRDQAVELLSLLREDGREALRLGLSGTPGVGKSTFIESFGMMLAEEGKRIAVLAVDPSSARSGGSILGDKTRMEQLSRHPNAFIRPSPSRAHMGGIARRTREAVALCEAAGFDLVLIETVGVGQSETMVAEICDIFLLLMAPAGGDELQGVKRGIMEMADMILVNKADGDLLATATRTVADYAGALRLLRRRPQDPQDFPKAMPVSAVSKAGLEKAWEELSTLAAWRQAGGHWARRRSDQAAHWFGEEVRHGLLSVLEREPARGIMARLGAEVAAGDRTPEAAAAEMLRALGRA
ncbi:methylmalonyl Co-A mutase-associated GTPase MeaB [Pseudogemmobacter humi]|uniref:Putative GTPase/MT1543 n=1 Tax=Pseudogemmobacter humi TaxID=2483812 RepID=A0A3P5XX90_9RHOB|nr:methylmalonyl Co-A mutase-associated GTPase MeaB [Pseudogemmobacter humi]VDC33738.1 putative GTPase/MT1543 [Pseudogemmobacter humi]